MSNFECFSKYKLIFCRYLLELQYFNDIMRKTEYGDKTMDTKKLKKDYAVLQMKLFDYVSLLEDMLSKYLTSPQSISYKKITRLNRMINNILLHNHHLQNKIIYGEYIA